MYYSFLICVHPDVINVYWNGLPIGEIRNGEFAPHEFIVNEERRVITMRDFVKPCPFKTVEELKKAVHQFVESIKGIS